MSTGIFQWENERELDLTHPIVSTGLPAGLLLDAKFQQFDGFIPILKTIQIEISRITLVITFDQGDLSVVVEDWLPPYHKVIYQGDRHVGTLLFSSTFKALTDTQAGKIITVNAPFNGYTVRSIPSSAGVYSIRGKTGDVTVELSDLSLSVQAIGNTLTWGARATKVAGLTPLKTINGVSPLHNNLALFSSQLLKLRTGINSVEFYTANTTGGGTDIIQSTT